MNSPENASPVSPFSAWIRRISMLLMSIGGAGFVAAGGRAAPDVGSGSIASHDDTQDVTRRREAGLASGAQVAAQDDPPLS